MTDIFWFCFFICKNHGRYLERQLWGLSEGKRIKDGVRWVERDPQQVFPLFCHHSYTRSGAHSRAEGLRGKGDVRIPPPQKKKKKRKTRRTECKLKSTRAGFPRSPGLGCEAAACGSILWPHSPQDKFLTLERCVRGDHARKARDLPNDSV